VDGVRVVHNAKGGLWGRSPKVTLTKVGTLGDVEATDPNLAFTMPSDLALDASGNLYVLDTGNHRVQKFGPGGKFLASFGRQGQGPGDFYYPESFGIDGRGTLFVADTNNQRIQVMAADSKENRTIRVPNNMVGKIALLRSGRFLMGPGRGMVMIGPGGPEKKEEPAKLLKILDLEGRVLSEFGTPFEYGEMLLNRMGNEVLFTADAGDNVYLVFPYQNRIEKFSPATKLLWKADRPLHYSVDAPKDKGKMEQQGGRVSFRMPQMNRCAGGPAVDGKGRLWVATLNRQLKKEEQVSMNVTAMVTSGGGRTMGYKAEGDTDLQTTDAYKLEVFDPDGLLLGEIPVDSFVDGIFIFGDRLFLLDKLRGTRFTEYKIVG
ncbi:MAG: NHL repeat-containing protein, partial [Candidatus Aminicenantes bacterium]|nr:NHL repeat-containing protein [Candidatus Aminicenantes bacterium]